MTETGLRQPPFGEKRPSHQELTEQKLEHISRLAVLSAHIEAYLLRNPDNIEPTEQLFPAFGLEQPPEFERFKDWQREVHDHLLYLEGYLAERRVELAELMSEPISLGQFAYHKLTGRAPHGEVTFQREPTHFVLIVDDLTDYEAAFKHLSSGNRFEREIGLGFFAPHFQLREHWYDQDLQRTMTETHTIPVVVVHHNADFDTTILHERQHVLNHTVFGILERRNYQPIALVEDEIIASVRSADISVIRGILRDDSEEHVVQLQELAGPSFSELIGEVNKIADRLQEFEQLISDAAKPDLARSVLANMLVRVSINNMEAILVSVNWRIDRSGQTPDQWYLAEAHAYFDQLDAAGDA
jgi:hypothetical protein